MELQRGGALDTSMCIFFSKVHKKIVQVDFDTYNIEVQSLSISITFFCGVCLIM
jgi:hypothetical protein